MWREMNVFIMGMSLSLKSNSCTVCAIGDPGLNASGGCHGDHCTISEGIHSPSQEALAKLPCDRLTSELSRIANSSRPPEQFCSTSRPDEWSNMDSKKPIFSGYRLHLRRNHQRNISANLCEFVSSPHTPRLVNCTLRFFGPLTRLSGSSWFLQETYPRSRDVSAGNDVTKNAKSMNEGNWNLLNWIWVIWGNARP